MTKVTIRQAKGEDAPFIAKAEQETDHGVHKGHQGKGIGSMLMEKLIEWAKHAKVVEKIELNVRASNSRARALYLKFGFEEEGRLKRRVKQGTSISMIS